MVATVLRQNSVWRNLRTPATSMLQYSSQSMNTGLAPTYRTALTWAMKVTVGTMTSSSVRTPDSISEMWSAEVPQLQATASVRETLGHRVLETAHVFTVGRYPGRVQAIRHVIEFSRRKAGFTQGNHRQLLNNCGSERRMDRRPDPLATARAISAIAVSKASLRPESQARDPLEAHPVVSRIFVLFHVDDSHRYRRLTSSAIICFWKFWSFDPTLKVFLDTAAHWTRDQCYSLGDVAYVAVGAPELRAIDLEFARSSASRRIR